MAQQDIAPTDNGADSLTKIEANFTELYTGANINAADAKTTPADADEIGLIDSVTETLMKLTWANLKATLLTYFYTIFPAKDGWMPVADSWSYASADAPTFVITIPAGGTSLYSPGMRIKLTQTTVKYFIITAVADTILTVYGGTDYTLVNAAISAISYSTQKAPLGFPLNPGKWTVETKSTAQQEQVSPVQNTWYNIGSNSISIPIGSWDIMAEGNFRGRVASGTEVNIQVSISTSNNSESNADNTFICESTGSTGDHRAYIQKTKTVKATVATKTTYYLIFRTLLTGQAEIRLRGDHGSTIIRAVCAYL